MATLKCRGAIPASQVKGPIRCHKCQLVCRDAALYLTHKCEPNRGNEMSLRWRVSTNGGDVTAA